MTVVLKVRFPVDDAALSLLHQRAFSPDRPDTATAIRPWAERLDRHSLTWIGAFSEGQLVGFVHAVWDGGTHAFILDTAVHPDFQRLGIGRDLVRAVTDEAFKAGCDWVHVDYEPEFASFYESACGFRPTPAGLRSARLPQPLRSVSATPSARPNPPAPGRPLVSECGRHAAPDFSCAGCPGVRGWCPGGGRGTSLVILGRGGASRLFMLHRSGSLSMQWLQIGTCHVPLGDAGGVRDRSGGLFADELFAQDVGVTAVLGKLAQHVQVHPAERERAAPVAVQQVVQFQG